jgi:hypothetical protein
MSSSERRCAERHAGCASRDTTLLLTLLAVIVTPIWSETRPLLLVASDGAWQS